MRGGRGADMNRGRHGEESDRYRGENEQIRGGERGTN